MNQINCMIVDDEPIARDIITSHIEATATLKLIKSCINASEAYEALHNYQIDLIFLDIQMPVISGTDFLRSLRNPPLVVFTTAYHHYAIEGFELNSVDYLLKPVTYDRFHQAIEKVGERINYRGNQRQEHPGMPAADYLFIKQDTKLIRVNHNQIDYIQAEKDFSSVYLGDKRLFASMHLKMFEDSLPQHIFLRVHRSFIVNLSKIKSIKGNTIELDRIEIPIGANYKERLLAALGI